jgi:hypothetical protein
MDTDPGCTVRITFHKTRWLRSGSWTVKRVSIDFRVDGRMVLHQAGESKSKKLEEPPVNVSGPKGWPVFGLERPSCDCRLLYVV